jgi:N-acetylglucosamine kinase-like BadF-type ATPase
MLEALMLGDADALPPWVGRAPKSEVAALTVHVLRLAGDGDAVARRIVQRGAADLVSHAVALVRRLQPWAEPPRLVPYGGVLRQPLMRDLLARALAEQLPEAQLVDPVEDAVAGALRYSRKLALN